jgi:hypothetical protein
MALTGDPAGPPLAPPTRAAAALDEALAPFGLGAGVLAERAASAGLTRGGHRSCGGGARLLRAAGGWIALSLSRPDDVASLPALLERDLAGEPTGVSGQAPWTAVARLVADRDPHEIAGRAELLGMPCAVVPGDGPPGDGAPGDGAPGERAPAEGAPAEVVPEEVGGDPGRGGPFTVTGQERATGARPEPAPAPYVVDLSALWAGPLATSCLLRAGATVVKVEDPARPDGARGGDGAFYDLLNAGKASVAADLSSPAGRSALGALVDRADIVVTGSRARAVTGLGLDPAHGLAGATDKVWVAVTAHGWASSRVGFGDDVAASAGLVAWHPGDGEPRFAGDAIADPLCGALAAQAARAAWARGGRWFVDASLAAAASFLTRPGPARAAAPATGGGGWSLDGEPVAEPRRRRSARVAAALGADTTAVLAAVCA